jgi:hypothetical protein
LWALPLIEITALLETFAFSAVTRFVQVSTMTALLIFFMVFLSFWLVLRWVGTACREA